MVEVLENYFSSEREWMWWGSGTWKISLFYLNRILNFNSDSITRIIVWNSRKLKKKPNLSGPSSKTKLTEILCLVVGSKNNLSSSTITCSYRQVPQYTTKDKRYLLISSDKCCWNIHILWVHFGAILECVGANCQSLISAILSVSNIIDCWCLARRGNNQIKRKLEIDENYLPAESAGAVSWVY